jgi:hypothetical protein
MVDIYNSASLLGSEGLIILLGIIWIIIGIGAELIGSILQMIWKKQIENEWDDKLKIQFFMWGAYSFLVEIFYFPFLSYNLLVKNGNCLMYSDKNKTHSGIDFSILVYIFYLIGFLEFLAIMIYCVKKKLSILQAIYMMFLLWVNFIQKAFQGSVASALLYIFLCFT